MKFVISVIAALTVVMQVRAQMTISPDARLSPLRLSPSVEKERPVSVDNSKLPYFPAIISQHGSSCAQASAIHYLFTYEMNRVLEKAVENKYENTFSYRYIWNFLNEGGNNGSISSDGLEITHIAGCMTVKDFGNEDDNSYIWPSGYLKYYNAMHYRTKNMFSVDLSGVSGIETLMDYMTDKNDGHPGGGIAVFSISGDFDVEEYNGPSQTGLKDIVVLRGNGVGHAMTFVGFDRSVEYDSNNDGVIQDSEKGAFILANSWGTWWGSDGFAYIPFSYYLNSTGQGGLEQNDMYALCIETEYHEPSVTMGVKLNYNSRNDLILRFGVADGAQSKEPVISMDYPIVKAQGGDHNMRGTYYDTGNDIEMGFDLSSLEADARKMKAPCWFLVVTKVISGKNGQGYVSEITLHDLESGTDNSYTERFTKEDGKISMVKYYKVPTKPWFKNSEGRWYEQISTSANPLSENRNILNINNWEGSYAIRKADGGFAKMQINGFDSKSGVISFDIANYE